MIKIQNQQLSRLITHNQVLAIPLNIIGFCISPTQLKNLLPSNCILNPRCAFSLPSSTTNEIQVWSSCRWVKWDRGSA